MNKLLTVSVFAMIISFGMTNAPMVSADDARNTIEISGNGAESQNNVSQQNSSSTTVQQQNDANVNNSIENTAETGNNSVENNTNGDQTIVTGKAETETNVSNELNQSTAVVGCCEEGSTALSITNNGAGSENTLNVSSTNQTSVTNSNGAKIVNNFKITANTGKNTANFNTGGDTKIITGEVTVNNHVVNGPINVNRIAIAKGTQALKSTLAIAGNGAFSENLVTEVIEQTTVYQQDNFISIFNNVEALMNTGANEANYNSDGDILVMTGSIIADFFVTNLANSNIVETIKKDILKDDDTPQAHEEPIQQTPNQPETATTATSVAGASGTSTSSDNAVQSLPITGTNLLFFLLLANIMMFFLGAYLRLRSGRSPGYSFSL